MTKGGKIEPPNGRAVAATGTRPDPLKPGRATYAARVAHWIATDPGETIEKVKERVAVRRERWTRHGHSPDYPAEQGWEERLHGLIGAPWPCSLKDEFEEVWSEVVESMRQQGLRVGRQNYGRDDDADPGLARALFCLARQLRPDRVVETGVAHGVSSRCILEALERNGCGRLWSIDLPPLTIPERRREIAAAVPDDRRQRWTYIEGSSRRRLPGLLAELGDLQLFFHDSLHSTRNTRWELVTVWPYLQAGGAVLADDMDHNWGFELFAKGVSAADVLHCVADDEQRLFGIALKQAA